ncbi:tagaturonate reductase [Alicyclobacillus dauci]|uniref:Tagaturonate reductase n=1 Tax=Alicyclobacillus dauci TaxID=1475485 RepID=A0ABY6Z6Z5_9BACL|nr:tagaturonate reductase [Alicyclobacillus dauci]WAH38046.1 tagaturonate reductase [Alicyclobacillus dauci]
MELSRAFLHMSSPAGTCDTDVALSYPERVLQIGEGNFLRAFTGWAIHLLNQNGAFCGRIVVVAPRPSGADNIAKINRQDGLYTVWLRGIEGGQNVDHAEIVTSVSRGIDPYRQWDDFLRCAESRDIDIVISNTTEAGMTYTEEVYDPAKPLASFPGKLTAYLYHRYLHFQGDPDTGLTILPCELVEHNGELLKEIVLRHASEWGLSQDFRAWVQSANHFCNTLVDRIVTGFPDECDRQLFTERTGYEDALLTVGEPFFLWAIEAGESLRERLPGQRFGINIRVAQSITPYTLTKVRILNGAHTAMSAVALLEGIQTVGEVMADPTVKDFIVGIIQDEVIPVLSHHGVSEADSNAFAQSVIERFENPFIHHEIANLALNGLSKIGARIVPTIVEYEQLTGDAPSLLSISFAAQLLYYRDVAKYQSVVRDNLAHVRLIQDVWSQERQLVLDETVRRLLAMDSIWGLDLCSVTGLTAKVTEAISQIRAEGVKNSIRQHRNSEFGLVD